MALLSCLLNEQTFKVLLTHFVGSVHKPPVYLRGLICII